MTDPSWKPPVGPDEAVAGALLVLLRGILLWILVPGGVIVWLSFVGWSGVTLGNFLGWLDYNVIVLLQKSVFRPWLGHTGLQRVPWARIRELKHRINFGGLF